MIRKTISDAVSGISDRHIDEAADFSAERTARDPVWLRVAVTAACFCLVVTGCVFFAYHGGLWRTSHEQTPVVGEDSTETDTAPQTTELITDTDTEAPETEAATFDTETEALVSETEEIPPETDEEDEPALTGPAQKIGPITGSSIRDLKALFENKSELEKLEKKYSKYSKEAWQNIDTSKWRELSGLGDEYKVYHVEWGGGNNYSVIYTEPNDFFYEPFLTEDDFNDSMSFWMENKTYESLLANQLVSNVVKETVETSLGTAYECTYDTKSVVGLRARYHEYTDAETGIQYTVAQSMHPDGTISSSVGFVLDGENSFLAGSFSRFMTLDVLMTLKSVPLE